MNSGLQPVQILRLQNNKWFVSSINAVDSNWIRLHPCIAVERTIHINDEDVVVRKMMMEYGIDNVRGGSYSRIDLPSFRRRELEYEFAGVDDRCVICGDHRHVAVSCSRKMSDADCSRCERRGHTTSDCQSVFHPNGTKIVDSKSFSDDSD